MAELLITEISVVGGSILIQQHRDLDQCPVATVRTEDLTRVASGPVQRPRQLLYLYKHVDTGWRIFT